MRQFINEIILYFFSKRKENSLIDQKNQIYKNTKFYLKGNPLSFFPRIKRANIIHQRYILT